MDADVLIVGAGVVGLACGAALARRGKSVLLVERHEASGREVSSRNSEVIHAGLYYPKGTNKARTCSAGRDLLYAHCAARNVPHRKTGKYVVATQASEVETLEGILERAQANGAPGLELVTAAHVNRAEPRVQAVAALWSPESGIVEAHGLMDSYQAEMEEHGGMAVFHTTVLGLAPPGGGRGWQVDTRTADGEAYPVEVEWVVNAAGLSSDRIAELAGIDVDAAGLRIYPCKGDYFAVAPSLGQLTNHLVYPVPVKGGLGTHVTLDLGGRYRLGPDVEWVDELRYDVDPNKATEFAAAVQRYLPEIKAEHLTVDFAGIRPKLQKPQGEFRDFHVAEASELGAPRLINLSGIESPGLTAAGAIAKDVAAMIA
jgi:L-2-hydroxyglutarate oxidase LhgO